MKLHELIRKHPWTEDRTPYPIWEEMLRFHPYLREEGDKALAVLQTRFGEAYDLLRAMDAEETDWMISMWPLQFDEIATFAVSGIDPQDPVDEMGNRKPYMLAFKPWEKWLGMEIDPVCFHELSETEVLAFILMEITYAGMTPQRQNENRQGLIELGEGDT
ncbi:MAG: hypothetical protein JJU29_15195 [Verrucomicrobia bacterium]|nr:hypothetical protein [Verrucomicrobiota bacterium]MCH8513183.1 hypothetical protein [Kiritimatiellia bacterium]